MVIIGRFAAAASSNMPACAARLRSTAALMTSRSSSSVAPARSASRSDTSFAPNRQTFKLPSASSRSLCCCGGRDGAKGVRGVQPRGRQQGGATAGCRRRHSCSVHKAASTTTVCPSAPVAVAAEGMRHACNEAHTPHVPRHPEVLSDLASRVLVAHEAARELLGDRGVKFTVGHELAVGPHVAVKGHVLDEPGLCCICCMWAGTYTNC